MQKVFNPGAGDGPVSNFQNAEQNITAFAKDLELPGVIETPRRPEEDGAGRFGFLLCYENRWVGIRMPGQPLEVVRYMAKAEQDPWEFPRLYVIYPNGDVGSGTWKYALNIARRYLTGIARRYLTGEEDA